MCETEDSSKAYDSNKCDDTLKGKGSLNNHEGTHTSSHDINHEQIQSNIRPFQREIEGCGKAKSSYINLRIHRKLKHGISTFNLLVKI